MTPRQRRYRVASGEWRRLPNGLLVVAGSPETFEMRATAALAAVQRATLSHQSAAQVLGVDVWDRRIHLTVPVGGTSRSAGAVVHQTIIEPGDVVVRRGFRITSLDRTLVDLGATLGKSALHRCIEDQLTQRTTTFDRVEKTFIRLARPGRTGIARTRVVLAAIDGKPPSESELEAMFHELVLARELPVPIRQMPLDALSSEKGRVDCWYPEARVIVELDGRRFHARLAAFERDRRRDQAALMKGIPTLRFTHHQIADDPDWVVKVLATVVDRACHPGQK